MNLDGSELELIEIFIMLYTVTATHTEKTTISLSIFRHQVYTDL